MLRPKWLSPEPAVLKLLGVKSVRKWDKMEGRINLSRGNKA